MICCAFLNPALFDLHERALFDILADNMYKIAPTGNSREEDHALWLSSMRKGLSDNSCSIILAFADDVPVGYLQFSLRGDTLMMEEIEIREDMQGRGVFRALYDVLLPSVRGRAKRTEAYANKANAKSIAILKTLGLSVVGENKSGRSWRFCGAFSSLERWHGQK